MHDILYGKPHIIRLFIMKSKKVLVKQLHVEIAE